MGTILFIVTCELCGQSWHRGTAAAEQVVECIFCGCRGRLTLGPAQVDVNGGQHVEAWLRCLRGS